MQLTHEEYLLFILLQKVASSLYSFMMMWLVKNKLSEVKLHYDPVCPSRLDYAPVGCIFERFMLSHSDGRKRRAIKTWCGEFIFIVVGLICLIHIHTYNCVWKPIRVHRRTTGGKKGVSPWASQGGGKSPPEDLVQIWWAPTKTTTFLRRP